MGRCHLPTTLVPRLAIRARQLRGTGARLGLSQAVDDRHHVEQRCSEPREQLRAHLLEACSPGRHRSRRKLADPSCRPTNRSGTQCGRSMDPNRGSHLDLWPSSASPGFSGRKMPLNNPVAPLQTPAASYIACLGRCAVAGASALGVTRSRARQRGARAGCSRAVGPRRSESPARRSSPGRTPVGRR